MLAALRGETAEVDVRLRLIELRAGKRTRGHETLLELFAKDPDASVREMAAALSGGNSPTKGER